MKDCHASVTASIFCSPPFSSSGSVCCHFEPAYLCQKPEGRVFWRVRSDVHDPVCGRDGQGRQRHGQYKMSDGERTKNEMDHRTGRKTASGDVPSGKRGQGSMNKRGYCGRNISLNLLKDVREHAACVESTSFKRFSDMFRPQ